MKFLQFGCWNQLKEKEGRCDITNPINPISRVMKKLKEYSEEDNTDFIIVSGDNYYTEKMEEDGLKKKTIHPEQLISGFQCLPPDIEINMILGNHDLETQTKKDNLYLSSEAAVAASEAAVALAPTKEKKDCFILQTELKELPNLPNIKYNFFLSKYDAATQTLILMVDTSMYVDDPEDIEDMLPCYKYIIDGHEYSIAEIRQKQKELIAIEIEKYKNTITKIIISGHHPIISYKLKVSEKDPKKTKFGFVEGLLLFTTLLKEIKQMMMLNKEKEEEEIKYYYLCADLHLYQKGTVILYDDEKKEEIRIEQYVVGTGGTELDPNPFDPQYNSIKGRISDAETNGIIYENEMDKNKYIMSPADVIESNANYGHGFLAADIQKEEEDKPNFKFIKAEDDSLSSMGGRKKRSTKKRSTKKTKKRITKKKKKNTAKSKYIQKNRHRL